MTSLNQIWKLLLSLTLLGALLMGCATQSKTTEIKLPPKVRIPDLPSSVKHTKPPLPPLAKDANDTSKALEGYEQTDEKNRFAIEQAQKHNRRLQKLYNKN